ncbi:GNAT family N-acetyltransferase [Isoptericola variabilis]|uniref:GCN5-related N-acetyltransferase n=1 Tax=Isoptericola variabilis (strain 225) TaxID=743718 RepID=F6FX29_ISOV2|nr:GNAT family N-acetyltransferase [Isoptericola variabilis]AEG44629.1 GCN5-related N-acetyltransferase [Isoptericola variabilis 225]TWH28317.1 RimJ/RimL family protein N-acetyltransferase [Isoptericola variabilis J7]
MPDASPLSPLTTDRLVLTAVEPSDVDELYALHADPRVWTHFPSGRHTERTQTERDVAAYRADWDRDGVGYWTARQRDDGAFVGVGGVRLRPPGVLNLYYRVDPSHQGLGFATELGRAALDVARRRLPDVPVTAYLLEHNHASRATAERLGLELVWRGPDAGNPDPEAVRLVYADRPLGAELLALLVRT